MPKQLYKLNDFSGGLNLIRDARDIAPNEVTQADHVSFGVAGSIKTANEIDETDGDFNIIDTAVYPGGCVFYFESDRVGASSANDTGEQWTAGVNSLTVQLSLRGSVTGDRDNVTDMGTITSVPFATNTLNFSKADIIRVGGTSYDFRIVHTSANNNTYVQNFTGHLYITNKSDDKDIIFQTDDGSGNDATYLYLDGSQSSSGNLYVKYPDNSRITLGDGSDLYFWHDGTDTQMQNSGGHLVFTQATDDKDMIFKCDDGSGGFTEYFKLDGSQTEVVFSKAIHSNGNIYVGDNKDLYIFHNGNDSYIQQVGTGDLIITQNVADRDIVFKSDDGSGGETEYFRLDGSVARVEASKSFRFIDNIQANFGSSGDLGIYHNGTDSYIVNGTGDLEIINNNDNGDISFISDNGSGSTTEYLRVDGGIESLVASKDLLMAIDGNGGKIKFGASQDLEIYHDGSNSHIDDTGTGNLVLRGNAAVSIQKYTGENLGMFNADGGVDLYNDDKKKRS